MPEREQGDRSFMTSATALHRLAEVAQERGLRLFRDPSGRWLCTSASDERPVHYVTALSCDCREFIAHQRCTHNAALLDHLGWLPERDPEPMAAIASERCISCTAGKVEEWGVSGPIGWTSCTVCQGSGTLPAAQPRPISDADDQRIAA